MSVVEATKQCIKSVCPCGALSKIEYSEVLVARASVQFPVCEECKKRVNGVLANPYDDSWANLSREEVRRQVIGQVVHKWALESGVAKLKKEDSVEDLMQVAALEGRHEFVSDDKEIYTAEIQPTKKERRRIYLETGKPVEDPSVQKPNKELTEYKKKVIEIASEGSTD